MRSSLMGSTIAFGLLLAMAAPANAIYKYVDENGRTHYTQTKPLNQNAKELNLRNTTSRAKPAPVAATAEVADAKPTEAEALKGELKAQKEMNVKRECMQLKQSMDSLAIDGRVYDVVDGKKVFLTGEQITAKRREARDQFTNRCQGKM